MKSLAYIHNIFANAALVTGWFNLASEIRVLDVNPFSQAHTYHF
jgi:hypothetical protein